MSLSMENLVQILTEAVNEIKFPFFSKANTQEIRALFRVAIKDETFLASLKGFLETINSLAAEPTVDDLRDVINDMTRPHMNNEMVYLLADYFDDKSADEEAVIRQAQTQIFTQLNNLLTFYSLAGWQQNHSESAIKSETNANVSFDENPPEVRTYRPKYTFKSSGIPKTEHPKGQSVVELAQEFDELAEQFAKTLTFSKPSQPCHIAARLYPYETLEARFTPRISVSC